MLSRILFAFLVLFPALASASLSQEQVTKEVAGRYRLDIGFGESIQFVLRSSGAVEVFDNDDLNGLTGAVSVSASSTEWGMDGLPVVHLVLGYGSDEDWQDHHVLLSVEEDGENRQIVLIASFTTFNDGPNGMSSVDKSQLKLSKFDKETDKFVQIK